MRTEFMGENPSLTTLFGDDIEDAIMETAAETGLPYETVKSAVIEYTPELLGEELDPYSYEGTIANKFRTSAQPITGVINSAPAPRGTTFVNVTKGIAEGIGQVAPGIINAIKGTPAPSGNTGTGSTDFDMTSLILPAGIAALLLFLIMKK